MAKKEGRIKQQQERRRSSSRRRRRIRGSSMSSKSIKCLFLFLCCVASLLQLSFASTDPDCISHLRTANLNDDSELNEIEYMGFVNYLSGGTFGNIFLFKLTELPKPIEDNFHALSCKCPATTADCCPNDTEYIDIDGLQSSNHVPTKEQQHWFFKVCLKTRAAVHEALGIVSSPPTPHSSNSSSNNNNNHGDNDRVPLSRKQDSDVVNDDEDASPSTTPGSATTKKTTASTNADVQSGVEKNSQSPPGDSHPPAKPPITLSLPQCFLFMTIADFSGNNKLNRVEYVIFLNQVSSNAYGGKSFSQLPEPLVDHYKVLTEGNEDAGFSIQGVKPGQNPSPAQQEQLADLCASTVKLINDDQSGESDVPTPAATPLPTPSPNASPTMAPAIVTASPAATRGPTVPLSVCFLHMTIVDGNFDSILDSTEYVFFVNQLSPEPLGSTFETLPPLLRSTFEDLSNGDGGINVAGSRPGQRPDDDQAKFLSKVCGDVDFAIDIVLSGGEGTPQPVVGATPTPATPQPTPLSGPGTPQPTDGSGMNPPQPTGFPGFFTPQPNGFSFSSQPNGFGVFTPQPHLGGVITPQPNGFGSFTPQPTTSQPGETPQPTTSQPAGPGGTLPPFGFGTPQPVGGFTMQPFGGITPAPVDRGIETPVPSAIANTFAPTGLTVNTTFPSTVPSPPTDPSGVPSFTPSLLPSVLPSSTFPSFVPSVYPTVVPTVPGETGAPSTAPSSSPTTAAPSSSPTTPQGTNGEVSGTTSFTMSNARELEAAHMVSGRTRNALERSFGNVVEDIVAARSSVATSGRIRGKRERERGRRKLVIRFVDASVDQIADVVCPNGVPSDFLCQEVTVSYRLDARNEPDSMADIRNTYDTAINAAIQRGELQEELNTVFPDSKVVIEEGDDIQRPSPLILESVRKLLSLNNIALIGGGVFIFLTICYCYYRCCRRKKPDDEQEAPEQASAKKGKKK